MTRFIVLLLFVHHLFSISGQDLALKINQRMSPTDSKADLSMTLTNKKGKTRSSIIKSISKDRGKKQIMWFLSPPSDRGISLYKIEKDSGKDEMKMWLPAFKKVRKISSRKKTERFMNSDLTFEDLYNREIDEYTYSLEISEDSTNYILTSIPNANTESSYSKHLSWINIESLLVNKEKSFGKSGSLVKTKEFKFINLDGYNMIKEIHVVDNKTKHKTFLIFENIIFKLCN